MEASGYLADTSRVSPWEYSHMAHSIPEPEAYFDPSVTVLCTDRIRDTGWVTYPASLTAALPRQRAESHSNEIFCSFVFLGGRRPRMGMVTESRHINTANTS